MPPKDENNTLPGSANRSDQSGVEGFAPNLGGHAKATHSNTSSFGGDLPAQVPQEKKPAPGQEEGGRKRQPTTSIVGRVSQDK